MVMAGARGQAFTLEGFVAALLLLASLAFVLQVTGVTPLSASTSNQHVENQQADMANGVLTTAAADRSLHRTLLYWDVARGAFHGTQPPPAGNGYYTACGLPTAFGDNLTHTFGDHGLACNVNLHYVDATTGTIDTTRLVYVGTPTDNAVRAVTTVTLYDDDRLVDATETPTNTTLASTNASAFYARDVEPAGPVYTVVQVEVIVWRT